MSESYLVLIRTDSDIVLARQRVRAVAVALGFSSTDQTLIATAISELARNILSYAKEGEIHIRTVERAGGNGVEVVARDSGPGIADVALAMRDGYSTGGGLGLGLPGTRRLVDDFELATAPQQGTTVTVRKWVAP